MKATPEAPSAPQSSDTMNRPARSMGLLLGAALAVSSARPMRAAEPLVAVRIRSTQPAGALHRLVTRSGQVVASCYGECTMLVPAGTYRFESGETEDQLAGGRWVDVRAPTVIDVDPGSRAIQRAGLVTAIIGTGAACVGVVGVIVASLQRICTHDCDAPNRETPSFVPWLVSLGAGTAVSTAGWIVFVGERTTITAAPHPRAVSFTAAPTSGGVFVGATFAF